MCCYKFEVMTLSQVIWMVSINITSFIHLYFVSSHSSVTSLHPKFLTTSGFIISKSMLNVLGRKFAGNFEISQIVEELTTHKRITNCSLITIQQMSSIFIGCKPSKYSNFEVYGCIA